ncbi:MAG: glycosyltransferase family 4 protein [Gaiellaceae bacterium]
MRRALLADEHPGRPRILFVGFAESTHTHAWIGLLDSARMNVRLFAVPSSPGVPPAHWDVPTFVTTYRPPALDRRNRQSLYSRGRVRQLAHTGALKFLSNGTSIVEDRWLADVIRRWRPDVVHTLGLDPAGYFYARVRSRYGLAGIGAWVCQLRGGSDLELTHLDPAAAQEIAAVFRECDYLLTDNERNLGIAQELGLDSAKLAAFGTVPGTGGVDVDALAAAATTPPAARREILWPKAYESPWSKAHPVFEALKLAWERIQPCRVNMLAATPETRQWFPTLPAEIQKACRFEDSVPREEMLRLMTDARVLLAPSLIDGTPNSLFEAMAAGALPIVSPIPTIAAIVKQEENVLFARNLYPDEIAAALVRAMTDDELVSGAAARNLVRVRALADRETIRERVVAFYEQTAQR